MDSLELLSTVQSAGHCHVLGSWWNQGRESRESRGWGQTLIVMLCSVCLVTLTGSRGIPELPITYHKAGSMQQGVSSHSLLWLTAAYCTVYHASVHNCLQTGISMWLKQGRISEGHTVWPSPTQLLPGASGPGTVPTHTPGGSMAHQQLHRPACSSRVSNVRHGLCPLC